MFAAVRNIARPGSRQSSSIKRNLLALAVAALVAGCGGGSDTQSSSNPEAVIGALRAQAQVLAASTVTSAQAAVLLMDWAEQNPILSGFFPEHQVDLTDVPPLLYRHYSSGVYLGVVVIDDGSGIPLNSVYVMGGPFGNTPVFAGPVTRFLDLVIDNGGSGGGGGGTNNGCYDLALFDTPGTQSVISYVYSGPITGNETVTSTVGDNKTFEGHLARETVATTVGSHTAQGVPTPVSINTQNKFYATRSGDELTQYGGISAVQANGGTTTIKSVFSPPYVDRQYTLAVGESLNASYSVTTTFVGLPFPPVTASASSTTKRLANENIVVQGKSYSTCKFEVTTPASNVVTTSWIVVGKGLPVKIVSGTQIIEATSATIGGVPL